jgi:hypothetical protein
MDSLPKRQRFPSSPCRSRVPASKWSNISALRRPLITRVSRHQLTAFSGDPIFLVHLIRGILHLRLKCGASAFLMMLVQLPNLKRCAFNSRGWWGYSFERKKLWLRDFAIGVVRCHVILSNPILIEQTPVQLGCNAFRMSSGWKCRKRKNGSRNLTIWGSSYLASNQILWAPSNKLSVSGLAQHTRCHLICSAIRNWPKTTWRS